MVRISGVEVSTEEATEIFFSDHRVNRMLVSILSVNTSIALPSLILLIPILAGLLNPDYKDYLLLLCLGVVPAIVIFQVTAITARMAKKNRSIKYLKQSAVLSIFCSISAVLGLISVGALLVFSSFSCSRPTCVSDAICSSLLCLITVIGIVYNIIHARVLFKCIWRNSVLQERTMMLDMQVTTDDNDLHLDTIETVSEWVDGRESPIVEGELGFSYMRFENPTEVFP